MTNPRTRARFSLRTQKARFLSEMREAMNLAELAAVVSDEAKAFELVERMRWPDGPYCPHCGAVDRIYELRGVKDKKGRVRPGLKKCYACRKQFTVRVGTVFEASHVPLHLWFQAAFLMSSSKKGISSNQLHRVLGVTLRTAWHMSHRIRLMMDDSSGSGPLGGLRNIVEVDETYYGRKEGAERKNERFRGS